MPYLISTSLPLKGWEVGVWHFYLDRGDIVQGIVEEENGNWLKIFFCDEENYVRWKNGRDFNYWGGSGIGAYGFDILIPHTGTYYLIVGHNDWWGNPEQAIIRLNRN